MLLDFLVPGFERCGTSLLASLLREHPGIFMPPRPGFRLFDLPDYESELAAFESRFAGAAASAILGDASSWYTHHETERVTRERILRHFPSIKLVFILRDPLARLESSFRAHHHSGHLCRTECPFQLADAIERLPDLVEHSLYAERLARYERRMPAENLLVLYLEELVTAPTEQLSRCLRFLGVEAGTPIASLPRRGPGPARLRDTPRLREMRRSPDLEAALQSVPSALLDRVLVQLGLRVPGDDLEIDWSRPALKPTLARIAEDATTVLERHRGSIDLWPRLAELLPLVS